MLTLPLMFLARSCKAILRSYVRIYYQALYDFDQIIITSKTYESEHKIIIQIPGKNEKECRYEITELGGCVNGLKLGDIKGGLDITIENDGVVSSKFLLFDDLKLEELDVIREDIDYDLEAVEIGEFFPLIRSSLITTGSYVYTPNRAVALIANPTQTEAFTINLAKLNLPTFSIVQELLLSVSNLKYKSAAISKSHLMLWATLPGGFDVQISYNRLPIPIDPKWDSILDKIHARIVSHNTTDAALWRSDLIEKKLDFLEIKLYDIDCNEKTYKISKKQLELIHQNFKQGKFYVSDSFLLISDEYVTHYSCLPYKVEIDGTPNNSP